MSISDFNDIFDFFRKKNLYDLKIKTGPWYDNFNSQFNLNIFDKEFNKEDCYNLIENNNTTFLFLRYEDINKWTQIFNKVLNFNINLPNNNNSSEKKYNYIYKYFKQNYKYSEKEYELILNINYMNYFYSNEELNSFLIKYK